MALTLGKNLWFPTPKWSDNSASRKTKDLRQHGLIIFATQALERGGLHMNKKTLTPHTWALEMGWLEVTVKVLKVETHIFDVL